MLKVVQKLFDKFAYLIYRLIVKNRVKLISLNVVSATKNKLFIRALWLILCKSAQNEVNRKNSRTKIHLYFRIIAYLQRSRLANFFLANNTFSSIVYPVHNKIKSRILRNQQKVLVPSHLNFSLFFLNKNLKD